MYNDTLVYNKQIFYLFSEKKIKKMINGIAIDLTWPPLLYGNKKYHINYKTKK